MSTAVYVRVSTKDQNPEGQAADLKAWVERNLPGPVEWFTDRETGTRLDRKEMKRLQEKVFAGEIKTVVCWKLDRLSRSLLGGIELVVRWINSGVRVVSITQQIDLTGTMGQTIAAVLFGFAQIEHEYRMERQAAGIRQAKPKGVYKGRKRGTTKKEPQRALELRGKGLQVGEIATALGTSVRTVHRYLASKEVA